MENKIEVLETFFKEVWTNENTSMIKQLFVPDEEDRKTAAGLSKEEKLSPEDFEGFQQALLGLVKNMVISIDYSMEKGDWISIRCSVTAENRETGRSTKMQGSGWVRISDGKIREAHNFFDFLSFFEDLELLPENTMGHCLQGGSLVHKA